MLVTFEDGETEVERVCRCYGCKNRFYTVHSGRGGRVKQYCSDACKTKAGRKGKAETALDKYQELQREHDGKASEARRLMDRAAALMQEADYAIMVMGVAQRENEYDRMQEDFTHA